LTSAGSPRSANRTRGGHDIQLISYTYDAGGDRVRSHEHRAAGQLLPALAFPPYQRRSPGCGPGLRGAGGRGIRGACGRLRRPPPGTALPALRPGRVLCGKTTSFGRVPSRDFHVNAAWLELGLAAIDLLSCLRVLLLDGELAAAEPKKLRYWLRHVAARPTCGGRRLRLWISATWPWRNELATVFHHLAALPRPAG